MSDFKQKVKGLTIITQSVPPTNHYFEDWSLIPETTTWNQLTVKRGIQVHGETLTPRQNKTLWEYFNHKYNIRVYCYLKFPNASEPTKFILIVATNRLNEPMYYNEKILRSRNGETPSSQYINYLNSVSGNLGVGYVIFGVESYRPNISTGGFGELYTWEYFTKMIKDTYGFTDFQIEYELFSDTFGDASTTDGYTTPSFDDTSDTIGIPDTPSLGVTNVGFMNVYKTSINQLSNLGEELFPDFISPTPQLETESVSEAIVDGFNNMVINLNNLVQSYVNSNLINYVIDCHIIPCNPATTGIEQNIKIGFKNFTSTGQRVTSDYVDIDCGTLNIGEYYTNFIDYVGTRAKLYLPFVGYVDIQNEYFQNGSLNVTYRFNVVDGSFICFVKSTSSKSELSDTVIATYSGNCCVHLPITGTNYSAMASSLITGAVGLASSPSASALLTSAIGTLSAKPTMQSSNSYNATSSYLGIRKPYLIIEREVSNFSAKYTSENGLPLNVTKKLSEISGFTVCDNIHLDGITCSEIEKNEILSLLQSGIIL